MKEDPIMQELRKIRRDLLREAGGDLGELLARADREAPKLLAKYRKPTRAKSRRGA
jgi:hypothetical protein